MNNVLSILLLPLDGRPVCYELPYLLGKMAGLNLLLPPENLLGQLKQPAKPALKEWFVKALEGDMDACIVALDTWAYGGLITSRIGVETLEDIQLKLSALYKWFDESKTILLFAFSAITRIPHYNGAEEEPDYWADYGEALYQYSVLSHQQGRSVADTYWREAGFSAEVLTDFLWRRERNFQVNQSYFAQLKSSNDSSGFNGVIDQLVFCQDDTGEFGLNVQEAQALEHLIEERHLQEKVRVQTGADEVASAFLSKAALGFMGNKPNICVVYSNDGSKNLTLRYDGVSAAVLAEQAIKACGAVQITDIKAADLILWVNTPQLNRQWDHIMDAGQFSIVDPVYSVAETEAFNDLKKYLINGQKLIVADVAFANGADYLLGQALLESGVSLETLYGYAAWNTGGNTIGSALATGCLRWFAELNDQFQLETFKQVLLTRWVDDWLYQAKWRYKLRQQFENNLPSVEEVNELMFEDVLKLQSFLEMSDKTVQITFPCKRLFEIKVIVNAAVCQSTSQEGSLC